MSTRVSLIELARIKRHGYKVERFTGTCGGWLLLDTNDPVHPEGDTLMIGDHGCIAPTQWEAVAEAIERIELDERLERELAEARNADQAASA